MAQVGDHPAQILEMVGADAVGRVEVGAVGRRPRMNTLNPAAAKWSRLRTRKIERGGDAVPQAEYCRCRQ